MKKVEPKKDSTKESKSDNKDVKEPSSDTLTESEKNLLDSAIESEKKDNIQPNTDKKDDEDELVDEPPKSTTITSPIIIPHQIQTPKTDLNPNQSNATTEKTIKYPNPVPFPSPIQSNQSSIQPNNASLNPISNDKTNDKTFIDDLKKIKENINLKNQKKIKPNKPIISLNPQDENYTITINIKVRDKIESKTIRPYIDNTFAFVCQGYDKVKKRPCFRYLNNLTYSKAISFQTFIEKYGCVCGDRSNHRITLNDVIGELFKTLLDDPILYENEFIVQYTKKLNFAKVLKQTDDEEDELSKSWTQPPPTVPIEDQPEDPEKDEDEESDENED